MVQEQPVVKMVALAQMELSVWWVDQDAVWAISEVPAWTTRVVWASVLLVMLCMAYQAVALELA